MNECKAVILGCSGTSLTDEEDTFFREHKPWGFILFARNIADAEQVRALTDALRTCSGQNQVPIFLDQEGGRVQRLRPPLAPNYPPASAIGELFQRDPKRGVRAAWLSSRLHAFDLLKLGINADCLPVLDVPVPGAHDVIGDRAYGTEPGIVADLGQAAIDGLLAGGVLPVMKHIPGHGRATADTHLALPTVDACLEELRQRDFAPFKAVRNVDMAMTAHVIYSALDTEFPATTSQTIIEQIIRSEIGFDGLLMSDDVSMKALSGDFASRSRAIIAAGCDVVLHCNGVMVEMEAVVAETPRLTDGALDRARKALVPLDRIDDSVEETVRAEFAELVQMVA